MTKAAKLKRNSRIMIIGSGGLHDVPVEPLMDFHHELVCVDLVHLPWVKKRYEKNERIQFVDYDITGLVDKIYQKQSFPNRYLQEAIQPLRSSDLVISLNSLSQLDFLLVRYAELHQLRLPENFRYQIQKKHLDKMHKLAPDRLLVTDVWQQQMRHDKRIDKQALLADEMIENLGFPDESWNWLVAPRGEISRKIISVHQVGCWQF